MCMLDDEVRIRRLFRRCTGGGYSFDISLEENMRTYFTYFSIDDQVDINHKKESWEMESITLDRWEVGYLKEFSAYRNLLAECRNVEPYTSLVREYTILLTQFAAKCC